MPCVSFDHRALDSRLKCVSMDDGAAQTDAPEAVLLQSIKPEVCPECGYNLSGLPDEGACPECGVAYGHEIVLFGWGAGSAMRRWSTESRTGITFWYPYSLRCFRLLGLCYGGHAASRCAVYARQHSCPRSTCATEPSRARPRPCNFGSHRKATLWRLGCGLPIWQTWKSVFALILKEQERGRYFISIHRMPHTVVANKRELRIELEIQGSVDAMRNIERLRQGPLSYVPCMVRSLRDS